MAKYLITGSSRGLGEALSSKIINNSSETILVGKTFTSAQLRLSSLGKVKLIYWDFKQNLNDIEKEMLIKHLKDLDELTFINNASVIGPIKSVSEFENDEVTSHLNINYKTPILLSSIILNTLSGNSKLRILNITSGAADRHISGWSLYSSTKKAVKNFFDNLENENENVSVTHIDPGVMDTGMQNEIRNTDKSDFPDVNKFKDLNEKKLLLQPTDVALSIIKRYC